MLKAKEVWCLECNRQRLTPKAFSSLTMDVNKILGIDKHAISLVLKVGDIRYIFSRI